MRPRVRAALLPELNLLPFLDVVLAFVGILIVVFALQAPNRPESGRPLAIDALIVCQTDGAVSLYTSPEAAPLIYRDSDLTHLLTQQAAHSSGTRNLVFALTQHCFATRQAFEQAFSQFTRRIPTASATSDPRRTVRLSFRPLSTAPEALPHLLDAWRTHGR